jgi:tetratricopeptide (TPR) repeat protein
MTVLVSTALAVAAAPALAQAAKPTAPEASPAKPAKTAAPAKTTPPAGDVALAKRYFSLGQELYRRANYQGALQQFRAAYKALPKADLLYNIARCLEATRKLEEAVVNYKRYLASLPPAHADRKLVQARINNLQAQLEKRRAEEQARKDALKREREARERAERLARDARAKQDGGLGALGIAGWSAAGVGVAGVVAGIVLGALASSKASELEDENAAGTAFRQVRDDINDGETLETMSIVALIAGGTTAIVGGVLLFLHYRRGGDKERPSKAALLPTLLPTVTPEGASLSAQFRF